MDTAKPGPAGTAERGLIGAGPEFLALRVGAGVSLANTSWTSSLKIRITAARMSQNGNTVKEPSQERYTS